MSNFMKSVLCGKLLNRTFLNQFSRSTSQYFQKNYKENGDKKQSGTTWTDKILIGTTLTALAVYKLYDYRKNAVIAQAENRGAAKKNLPNYTLEEIAKHKTKETRVWVTYKEGVYDITDYIYRHPGGDQIYSAAGGSLEPSFMVFAFHKNDHFFEALEKMRIGNITEEDYQKMQHDFPDPYVNDPKRHPNLKPASLKPLCGEVSPASLLVENRITPSDYFYVRNHFPVPQLDPKNYQLKAQVEGGKSITLSLNDIKKLPKQTVMASLMCSGNRRGEMRKDKWFAGVDWAHGAIGNATWSGPRLKDVLKKVGIEDDKKYKYVTLEGYDHDPDGKAYASSIPLWRVMDDKCDVILAYEMNGAPLPPDHGYPLRAVIPGVAGARSIKWLEKVIVTNVESDSHYQTHDYKGFSPSTNFDNVDHAASPPILELPVYSAICSPLEGERVELEDGHVVVKGYAYSGGGQKIVRVDVTADGGDTWHIANLDYQEAVEPPRHWSWTLWTARIPIKPGTKNVELWSRAVNSSYNVQPETFKNIWNFRGCVCNAYHRVPINIK